MTLKDNNDGTFSIVSPCSFEKPTKEEALKLADELDLIAGMIAIGDRIKWGQDSELMENGSAMIRRLVKELDKLIHDNEELLRCLTAERTKPLSDEEIKEVEQQVDKQYAEELIYRQDEWVYLFVREIEERHGIK